MTDNPWAGPPTTQTSSRTGLFIGLAMGGALLLVLVAAAGVLGYSWLQTQRPAPLVAAKLALTQEPGTGGPVKYGETPVYDACALVTIDALESLAVPLSAIHPVSHAHLDGDVSGDAAITPGAGGPVSSCFYMMERTNSLGIKVHQAPFNSPAELQSKLDTAVHLKAQVRTENGFSIATWHDQFGYDNVLISRPGLAVTIGFKTSPGDAAMLSSDLEHLVLDGIRSGPSAPPRYVYTAPLRTVKDPCDVASRSAFALTFPGHTGTAAMAEGSYTLHGAANGRNGQVSCRRNNIVPRGQLNKAEHHTLAVTLSAWDNKTAARQVNSSTCSSGSSAPVAVTPPIGSGRTCLADNGADWALQFQLDNVNVSIEDGDTANKPDASTRLHQLRPAAEAIASAGLSR